VPEYELSKAAEQDLEEIYAYSFFEFGEQRADAYFESLESSLQHLAEQPAIGMGVSSVRKAYSRLVHHRHSIYYKKSGSGILVIRILGPGMSPDLQ
jgi:toxin ParE1/3/4